MVPQGSMWGAKWLVAAVVVAAAGVLCPPAAGLAWRPVETISDAGAEATEPALAISPGGDAAAAWQAEEGSVARVRAASRPAGNDFRPAQTISPPGADARDPEVAIDGAGDALVVWERLDGGRSVLEAAFVGADGVADAPRSLADAGNVFDPDVAAVAEGQFVVSWYRSDGASAAVRAAPLTAAGFGPVQTVSSAGAWAQDPRVAGGSGSAVIVWRERSGGAFGARGAARTGAGSFGPPQALSAAGADAAGPEVAIDSAGAALAAWRERSGSAWRVAAAVRPAGGPFGTRLPLSATGTGVHGPAVAGGAGGGAVVAWSRQAGGGYRIEASARPAAGDFSASQVLSGTADAYGPAAALGPGGEPAVAWYEAASGGFSVRAASGAPSGAFGPAQTLSTSGDNAVEPRLEGSGEALLLLWSSGQGSATALRSTGVRTGSPGDGEPPPPAPAEGSAAPLDLRAPPGPAALLDRLAPRVAYFTITPRFAVARPRAASAKPPRAGARMRFGLSERAVVTIEIARPRGRLEGSVGPRYARAGDNTVGFSGRLEGRALPRGRHRATIVAIDAAGNRSSRRSDTFRVAKRVTKKGTRPR